MIKAVLFDFDGTIADTNDIILKSWRHVYLNVLGRECTDEEVTNSFGEVLSDTLIERFPDRDVNELVDMYRGYQVSFYKDEIKICEGMDTLVKELKAKGIKTGVVTSRVTSSTLIGLKKFGLENDFDTVVTCEDTDAHKPSPIPLQIGMDRLGVTPEECLYVGDSKYDVMCAHNAGVKAVLVNWTICTPESERTGNAKPDYIIDTAGELFGII